MSHYGFSVTCLIGTYKRKQFVCITFMGHSKLLPKVITSSNSLSNLVSNV